MLEMLDYDIDINIEEYQSYESGLNQYFASPLSAEIVHIMLGIENQLKEQIYIQ